VNRPLSQADLDELSAYLDGELDVDAAARVAALLATDDAWAQARADLQALSEAMDAYDVPPVPAGLADRICAAARPTSPVIRLVKWLAPVAAAAGVVLAVMAWQNTNKPQVPNDGGMASVGGKLIQQANEAEGDMPEQDRLAVEGMNIFKNYEVLDNFETLQAIDRLESQG
jgi:anti-sigma factor RsiW